MQTAAQKKVENIAEYVLYMYHVEDTIRKFLFNIPLLMEKYVKLQLPDASFLGQYENWYASIAHELQQTGKESSGHISEVDEVIHNKFFKFFSEFGVTIEGLYVDYM